MFSSKPAIHCWSTVKNFKNIIIHIFSKVKDIAKITRTKIGDFKDFKQQNLNKSIINKRALLKQKLINIYFWNGKRYPRNFNGFKLLRSYHNMYSMFCQKFRGKMANVSALCRYWIICFLYFCEQCTVIRTRWKSSHSWTRDSRLLTSHTRSRNLQLNCL